MHRNSGVLRAWFGCAVALAVCVGWGATVEATVWNVDTVAELYAATGGAGPNDEIIVAPGTYNLSSDLALRDVGLTLRGATGNRDDVVLVGGGMNTDANARNVVHVYVDNVTIRDLTVSECFWNGIQIHGESGVDGTVISNVKTLNIGERHIKGSRGSAIVDDVVIENCYMLQTKARQPVPGHLDPYDYIGGIDAMAVRNWVIRDCVFEDIKGANGGGRGAIFIWNGAEDLLVERNVIVGCDRGIAIGNPSGPTDSFTAPYHLDGGLIRNNVVTRGSYIALELNNTKDLKVYNNTIYSADVTYARTVQILDQTGEGLTTNLDFANNIIRGRINDITVAGGWTPEAIAATGNIVDTVGDVVTAGWFVDPSVGDLHLTLRAADAIDQGAALIEVADDMDGGVRPVGGGMDFGADELLPGDCDYDGDVDLDDWADLVAALAGPDSPLTYAETDGRVVVEAEHYSVVTAGSGSAQGSVWLPRTDAAAAGGVTMQASPDSGLAMSDPVIESDSPHLSFSVQLDSPVLFFIWVRGRAINADAATVHFGSNGNATSKSPADAIELAVGSTFEWSGYRANGLRPAMVGGPAARSMDLWLCQDGAEIDRVLLTTDVSYVPDAPAETPPAVLSNCDLNGDGRVDVTDVAVFAEHFTGS